MITPFPKDAPGRKAVAAQMQAASPAIMADVAHWRQLFPGARLTYFKAPGIEVGVAPKPGWLIDDDLVARVQAQRHKDNPEPEVAEAKRISKKASSARKRR